MGQLRREASSVPLESGERLLFSGHVVLVVEVFLRLHGKYTVEAAYVRQAVLEICSQRRPGAQEAQMMR